MRPLTDHMKDILARMASDPDDDGELDFTGPTLNGLMARGLVKGEFIHYINDEAKRIGRNLCRQYAEECLDGAIEGNPVLDGSGSPFWGQRNVKGGSVSFENIRHAAEWIKNIEPDAISLLVSIYRCKIKEVTPVVEEVRRILREGREKAS